jgi:hypothetical protein
MIMKGERVMVAAIILTFVFAIVFVKITMKLPEREIPAELHGWHLGIDHPPSSMIGRPLSYLKFEYFPARTTQFLAYYRISNGFGAWYLGLGTDDIRIDAPDYWIEFPPEVSR